VYRQILNELHPLPLVIRTLDLGGDKQPLFNVGGFGSSPLFGMGGLRLSLNEEELFLTQLKAIGDVARTYEDVSILFPMVASAEDLEQALEFVDATISSDRKRPRVGAMIETPSALFEIEEILDVVDFISVGTNDLVQFLLAIERRSVETLSQEAFFQAAVLRAISHVVSRAHEHDKPVTVCGESAGDPAAAGVLVGLGVSSLSMSPVRAARVRAAIRGRTMNEFEQMAARAMAGRSRADVMTIIESDSP
jgi:phosphoenolpyruvate-protein kinase (PTS system EI component)